MRGSSHAGAATEASGGFMSSLRASGTSKPPSSSARTTRRSARRATGRALTRMEGRSDAPVEVRAREWAGELVHLARVFWRWAGRLARRGGGGDAPPTTLRAEMDLRVRTWTGYRGSAIRDARDRAGRGGATRSVRQSATDTVREDSDRDAFGSRAVGDGRTWRGRRSAPRALRWEWRWQTCALDWDGRRSVQRPAIVPGPRLEGGSKPTVGSVGTRGFDFGAMRLFIRRGRERKTTRV